MEGECTNITSKPPQDWLPISTFRPSSVQWQSVRFAFDRITKYLRLLNAN